MEVTIKLDAFEFYLCYRVISNYSGKLDTFIKDHPHKEELLQAKARLTKANVLRRYPMSNTYKFNVLSEKCLVTLNKGEDHPILKELWSVGREWQIEPKSIYLTRGKFNIFSPRDLKPKGAI